MSKKLSKNKAALMLEHGEVKGRRITPKQKRFFQAVAHGMIPYQDGGNLSRISDLKQQLETKGITDNQIHDRGWFEENLSRNLNPFSYKNKLLRVLGAGFFGGRLDPERAAMDYAATVNSNMRGFKRDRKRVDAFNFYTGKPQKYNTFGISDYMPTINSGEASIYYKYNDNSDIKEDIVKNFNKDERIDDWGVMGHYRTSKGSDERGNYISYYDKWDISPIDFGKPFEIYDRLYYEKDQQGNIKIVEPRNAGNYIPSKKFELPKGIEYDTQYKYQNGGWLDKYQDGGQLQKLNKLSNFTKPVTGGWLDKYQ